MAFDVITEAMEATQGNKHIALNNLAKSLQVESRGVIESFEEAALNLGCKMGDIEAVYIKHRQHKEFT